MDEAALLQGAKEVGPGLEVAHCLHSLEAGPYSRFTGLRQSSAVKIFTARSAMTQPMPVSSTRQAVGLRKSGVSSRAP